jgi:hypothetical protein
VLGSERATYGEQIVVTLSRQLVVDYSRGYSEKNLRRIVQFVETLPRCEPVKVTTQGRFLVTLSSSLNPYVTFANSNCFFANLFIVSR